MSRESQYRRAPTFFIFFHCLVLVSHGTRAFLLPRQTFLGFSQKLAFWGAHPLTPSRRVSSALPLRAASDTGPTEGNSIPDPVPNSDNGIVVEGPIRADDTERFLVDISVPEPLAAELEETNLVKIVKLMCKDEEVNWLAWKCLGYRYVPTEGRWDNTRVFPKWRARYPDPPDLVGVTRIYEKEVDFPVKRANTALVRSVPKMYKQSLKELLAPYGFKGYKFAELTPNRTRRAQVCNWLLYYKRDLWGISLEDLLKAKETVTQVTREGESPEQLAKKMVY